MPALWELEGRGGGGGVTWWESLHISCQDPGSWFEILLRSLLLKARLHMRFLMRFLMRFRIQNAPDPTLHECLFREASCGLERKLSHIIWRHPSFEFLPTWRYFVAALRDFKPMRGRLGQVLYAKSHQNRIENRMCKRALRILQESLQDPATILASWPWILEGSLT